METVQWKLKMTPLLPWRMVWSRSAIPVPLPVPFAVPFRYNHVEFQHYLSKKRMLVGSVNRVAERAPSVVPRVSANGCRYQIARGVDHFNFSDALADLSVMYTCPLKSTATPYAMWTQSTLRKDLEGVPASHSMKCMPREGTGPGMVWPRTHAQERATFFS